MPYGIDKNQGGDSPSNVAWMERCVKSVKEKNPKLSKGSAIAICKKQLSKTKDKDAEISLDFSIIGDVVYSEAQFISKKMKAGLTFEQARALYDATLAKFNYNTDEL